MSLDWPAVVQSAVSGAAVAWPVAVVSLAVSHRRTRAHVDRSAERQNEFFRRITRAQTAELERRRDGGGAYHGDGDDSG